jgi:BNR/Asp-box repeat
MNALKYIRSYFLLCSTVAVLQPLYGLARQASDASTAIQPALEKDGQHDFDFEIGTWKSHGSRRLHPLTGSATWAEFDGISVVRKVWNGRANLVELEADGPAAGHIENLSLRLYNPQSHQWSLYYASSKSGALSVPAIGEFKNGRGEFLDMELINGRNTLVRNVWSDITPNSCHFEQAFSDDEGKTWEVNWITTDTRVNGDSTQQNSEAARTSLEQGSAERDGEHHFDFEIGSWNIHLSRLKDRLVGSTTWVDFDGTSVTRKVWNGRANLEEFETDSSQGHIEGLTLRLYNPQSHQWSIYWANGKDGILGQPMIGEFKNGRGEFFDQEPWKGRVVYVRFIWSDTTTKSPHFEQAFSDDGGKTWEVNWITNQTRVNDESAKSH